MKTIDILGANRFESYTKTRSGSRALILREDSILLSHEIHAENWLIPGGGMGTGETPEECCIREVEEETGLIVRPLYQFLTLNEYYEEYRYISHYFVCEATGRGQMRLTQREEEAGARPEWLPLREAIGIFSRHQDWAETNEERRGMYLREYTALMQYMEGTGKSV